MARGTEGSGKASYGWGGWFYIFAVTAAGAAVEAAMLPRQASSLVAWERLPSLIIPLSLFLLGVLAGLFPARLGRSQKMSLGTAATFVAVLLLPSALPGLISAGAVLVYSTALRRPWYNVTFSFGQHVLSASAAALVYAALWGVDRPPLRTSAAAFAAVLAALAFVMTSTLVLSGVIAATQRRALIPCWQNLLRQSGAQYLALLATAAIAAVCWWFAPWAAPLPILALPLVHELNRSLEKLGAAKDDVEGVLARQRRFVSDLAHEIGTPLTTLGGNLELLRAGSIDDPVELQETLQDLGAEFTRLSSIFNGLVVLAEADERGLAARRSTRLDRLVAEAAPFWQHNAGLAQVSLVIDPLEPTVVEGDEGRLRLAVGELVENALRFTPAGGTVQIGVRRADSLARITVADNGSGISDADLPHVFERFYRGQSTPLPSRSRSSGGSGLGLAIVEQVVQVHGGQIRVESAVGRGTRFQIDLPASDNPSGRGSHG